MEGAILSTPSSNRFRTHLKNAASALCARTLPKQRRSDAATMATSTRQHHTYPRAAPLRRTPISCHMKPLTCDQPQQPVTVDLPLPNRGDANDAQDHNPKDVNVKPKGILAREVASAWECRVGQPDEPAPADRVQSLFNDIQLYPTKTQVFEMLVCARQCARRKSLTLTFGEFCVFAAELRKCSRQSRQTPPTKPESPLWNFDKELRDKDAICKHLNGSEASPPPCEVFLGGSCNPTTWRSDIAIPMLKKMGITYFNPQVEDWSTELMEVEHRAKAAARALLFVLDSETRAVAASVEAAHLAAAPRDLLLVLRPYQRHQRIAAETVSDQEYVELSRARATLQEAVERRGLPAFTDIPAALRCARAVLRGARTQPRHSLGHTILRLKRAFDAAGGRNAKLPRSRALDALRDVARVPRDSADRCLPAGVDAIDFETFCAAVAELATEAGAVTTTATATHSVAVTEEASCRLTMTTRFRRALNTCCAWLSSHSLESQARSSAESEMAAAGGGEAALPDGANGLRVTNARLRAYGRRLGLYIPKSGNRTGVESSGSGGDTASSGDTVFTPGTERRLERLPAMLGAPQHDVYLAGVFPSNQPRPEEWLRREGMTYVVPRANDYTRMFSAPARRAAPAHPESPRTDKKPRSAAVPDSPTEEVQLRENSSTTEVADRLSASDFYSVTEDVTPQPFKGTYDEDQILGARVLVFSMSAETPAFAAMVLAAHYMGLRPNSTVLIVQPMDPKARHLHQYSEAAVKDYNRGRHYLTDLARRSGVPVFDNVADAMACVTAKLRAT